MGVLGLIAGAGGLPLEVARACERAGRPVFVIRLKGMADPALDAFAGADVGLAEFGGCLKALRGAGCDRVAFAGKVRRPDFAALKPDLQGLRRLPAIAWTLSTVKPSFSNTPSKARNRASSPFPAAAAMAGRCLSAWRSGFREAKSGRRTLPAKATRSQPAPRKAFRHRPNSASPTSAPA